MRDRCQVNRRSAEWRPIRHTNAFLLISCGETAMVCPRRLRLVRRDAIYCRGWVSFLGLPWPGPPLRASGIAQRSAGHLLWSPFMYHSASGQIITLGSEAQTSRQPDLTTQILPLRLRSFGHSAQLFDDFCGAAVAAGWTHAVTVVDAHMDLPDIRLWPLNHRSPFEVIGSVSL